MVEVSADGKEIELAEEGSGVHRDSIHRGREVNRAAALRAASFAAASVPPLLMVDA